MRTSALVLLSFLIVAATPAEERRCRTTAELLRELASATPGVTVVLDDGEYPLESPVTVSVQATASRPFVITARNRGKAVITGNTRLLLRRASHVVIDGLVFRNRGSAAVRLEGCTGVRITRNRFALKEEGRGSWVMVTGVPGDSVTLSRGNRIDRNLFEGKKELGNFITVEGTKRFAPAVSQYDTIEFNHFRDIGPRAENVLEAIRIGSSEYTLSKGYTLLRNNLFERCDGDPEYISIKQSACTVRANTFRECLGSLSLRHGNGSVVEENVVLGNGRTGTFLDSTGKRWTLGTGGVRFCGDSMIVRGNYFEGLTGTEWDATIAATNGDADYGEGMPLTKHFRITNTLLEGNILVNNRGGLEIGFDGAGFQGNWWHRPPVNLTVQNNIIAGTTDTLVKLFTPPERSRFIANIVHPAGSAAASAVPLEGVTVKDPRLVRVNGLLLPEGVKSPLKILTAADVGPDAP
ncbi:MAG: hypothetical protein F9K22_07500 [Bacteroidetes bacterium]|nr:MAG: hypothetical protein F9K22_07500 [Bacteroidota bacterium]